MAEGYGNLEVKSSMEHRKTSNGPNATNRRVCPYPDGENKFPRKGKIVFAAKILPHWLRGPAESNKIPVFKKINLNNFVC